MASDEPSADQEGAAIDAKRASRLTGSSCVELVENEITSLAQLPPPSPQVQRATDSEPDTAMTDTATEALSCPAVAVTVVVPTMTPMRTPSVLPMVATTGSADD